MEKIVLNSYIGRGINGMRETILSPLEPIPTNWAERKVLTIIAVNHDYDEYPKSEFHGLKKYNIPVDNIAYIMEDVKNN